MSKNIPQEKGFLSDENDRVVDQKFRYYLIRYINIHFRQYSNFYKAGWEFILDIIGLLDKTRLPNISKFLLGIKRCMKAFNIQRYMHDEKEEDE